MRTTSASVAALAALCLTAACGGSGGDEEADSGGALTIWADEVRAPVLEEFTADFADTTGVDVVVEEHAEDLQEDYLTATEQGQGPDLVVGAHDWVGDFVRNGAVVPIQLNDDHIDALAPESVEAVTVEGQIYGAPYAMENLALLRNTDLAPDEPETFEELVEVGTDLVDDGEVDEAVMTEISSDGDPYHGYPLFRSMGGYLFGEDENGDPDPDDLGVDSEGGVAAFEKLHELGDAGSGVLRTSMNADNAVPFFEEADTPFLISGPWAVSGAEAAGVELEVSAIPGFEGHEPATPFLGVQTFYLSSQSDNAVFAEEFLTNHVLDVDLATALYEADPRTPALLDAFDAVSDDDPHLEGFQAAAEGGTPMPAIPEMNAVWEPFGRAMADVLDGASDGATAAEQAAAGIRDAIDAEA